MTAGDTVAKTIEHFQHLLMESSAGQFLSLEAVFSLIMPESYVGLPSMDVDTKGERAREEKDSTSGTKGVYRSYSAKEDGY